MKKFMLFCAAIAFLMAACGSQPASQDQVNTAVAAMFTENPPTVATETLAPPIAQEATQAPAFAVFTADDVIVQFMASGLEVGAYTPMTVDDYGFAPYVGQGIRFLIPSLGEDKGGRVVALDNEQDLLALRDYYQDLARSSAVLFSWVYVHHNIVLQINGQLSEAQALQYKAALESLVP